MKNKVVVFYLGVEAGCVAAATLPWLKGISNCWGDFQQFYLIIWIHFDFAENSAKLTTYLSMLQCSVWSKLYNNGEQWHRTACWNIWSHWHSNNGGLMVTHWHTCPRTCLLGTSFKPSLTIVCWTDNTFRDSFSCIIRSSVWVNVNGKAGLVVRRGDMSNREEIDCEILWFPPLSIWCPPDPQNYGIVDSKLRRFLSVG